jgi:hypothetical protein
MRTREYYVGREMDVKSNLTSIAERFRPRKEGAGIRISLEEKQEDVFWRCQTVVIPLIVALKKCKAAVREMQYGKAWVKL